jgi:hypothetical protein
MSKHFKVTLTAAVSVYVPEGRVADRAAPPDALLTRLDDAANWWSDGRRNLSVEQFQAAAETIVRNAIERLVEEHLREGDFKHALAMGGEAGERGYEKLNDHVALAMARVHVGETDVDNEHTLAFEIGENGQ